MGIEGYKSTIQNPAQIGLGALGKALELPGMIPGKAPTGVSAGTKTQSYEDLLKASELSSPYKRLSDITGSEFEDELYNSRRKRQRGLL
jgi:hypothetical protein